jgi:hypothetical protein
VASSDFSLQEPRSTLPLLATTPLSSHLLSSRRSACRGQPPPSRFHRRPSWGTGSPSLPLPLALSWSLSHRSLTPGGQVHRAIDHHASTSSEPTDHTTSFIIISCCSPTRGSTPTASRPRRRQPPLCRCLPHRR